jgi:hypothetical protein
MHQQLRRIHVSFQLAFCMTVEFVGARIPPTRRIVTISLVHESTRIWPTCSSGLCEERKHH